jgi:3-dehydroquinate synthase
MRIKNLAAPFTRTQTPCASLRSERTTAVADTSKPKNVQVYLGPRSYDVFIVTDFLPSIAAGIESWFEDRPGQQPGQRKALVVTDQNVENPHGEAVRKSLAEADWECQMFVMEPGEISKSLPVVSDMYDKLVDMKAGRQTVVFAVGGGVVGDTAGFAAATYARGIPFVQIPTTLLAHVDSSVGGKVGINHPQGKNLIGAFHQPLGVVVDTATLNTLPERDYKAGLAEVIKYGVILDDEFFDYLEQNLEGLNSRIPEVMQTIITRSCRLKADVVEQDEFEHTGLRAVLNYGHTFAHAFEALCQYGELLHGEAVAIGMVYASRLAERLNMIDDTVTDRQLAVLRGVGLPFMLPAGLNFSIDDMLHRMRLDKKTVGGKLRFVLPTKIGEVKVVSNVSEDDVRAVLADCGHN